MTGPIFTVDRKPTRFPKSRKLLTKHSYNRVFDRPNKSVDSCFTVLWKTNESDRGRLGLAISKKVVKRAVDRNHLKRLVREGFRYHQHCLMGVDIVVLARHGLPLGSNGTITDSLTGHWRRIAKRLGQTC
ncbi:MAG: ribonuclease P protein component [Gammaproteobacteria bacterium]|nr:ribonuclease P protein component [Gammaproteobacteria bacterium]